MPLRHPLPLLILLLLPLTVRANAMEGQAYRVVLPVDARGHWDPQGGHWVSLAFPKRPLAPKDVAPLSQDDVQAILKAFEGIYKRPSHLREARVSCEGANWERHGGTSNQYCKAPPHTRVLPQEPGDRIHNDYSELYTSENAGRVERPTEDNRFLQALKRSPRYMGAGARQAAEELFASPVFIASMSASMLLYMVALAAPEPFISKGAVAAITFWLMATYGFSEVLAVATAVKRLYDESSAAMSERALEEAAKHFGEWGALEQARQGRGVRAEGRFFLGRSLHGSGHSRRDRGDFRGGQYGDLDGQWNHPSHGGDVGHDCFGGQGGHQVSSRFG
jgi:hypothetical protein